MKTTLDTKKLDRDVDTHVELQLSFTPATELELKALGDNLQEGYIAGWASTPDRDRGDHIVMTGAFDESIRERGLQGPKGVKLLINHAWDKGAGAITVLETRNGRLWMEAQLNLDITYVKDAYLAAKSAGGYSFSVGFRRTDWAWIFDEDGDYEYLEIRKADLWEVSMVPFPMNEECTIEFMKSADALESLADFERYLISQGFAKSRNKAREITQVVKSALHVFQKEEPPRLAESDVKAVRAKLAALNAKMAPVADP
jgi:HK97 family phage prohead protease